MVHKPKTEQHLPEDNLLLGIAILFIIFLKYLFIHPVCVQCLCPIVPLVVKGQLVGVHCVYPP